MAQSADNFSTPAFLDLLRARDQAALHQLTTAYMPQIYRAARAAGLNLQNAEDVTQNTFVTFIEKIADFEGRSHVRTWLFGILYRKISETRRAAQKEERTEVIEEVMESRFKTSGMWARPPRAPDRRLDDHEFMEHLADCLEGLSTDQRLAFILREVEEMDSPQICEALDVGRSNLGVLLYRGRNRLRECLENKDR